MTTAPAPSRAARAWLRELSRTAQWHRRLLAAGLLAGSVAFALQALAPEPPATVPVVVAAADVDAGVRLRADDLDVAHRTPDTVPAGAVRRVSAAAGATLLSGVRRGEVLTDVRLVGSAGIAALGAGMVATPVRIEDAADVLLIRPVARVDVLAAGVESADGGAAGAGSPARAGWGTGSGWARLVASAARVIAVPSAGDGMGAGLADGALILLATSETTAARLAGAAVTDQLSVVLRD